MKPAVVLDSKDVMRIIAEHFGVDEKMVVKSQYSYTVITDKETEKNESE